MKRLSHTFLLLLAAALASCESDELTTTSTSATERKLILSPQHLEGEQYVPYEFKARVTNFPLSDIRQEWDFDHGEGFRVYKEQSVTIAFNDPRIYMVRMKAYDYFTNELLGADSIRVDIRPPVHFVRFDRDAIDTLLPMFLEGPMINPIDMYFTCSVPVGRLKMVWNFNDGSPEYIDEGFNMGARHYFTGAGAYDVILNVYDKTTNTYIGADTLPVTIHYPAITINDLRNARSVAAYLAIDSTHPAFFHDRFRNPLAVQLPLTGDLVTVEGGATDLTLIYNNDSEDTVYHLIDTIAMDLTADLSKISSLRVGVFDNGFIMYPYESASGTLKYSYEVKDLALLSITPQAIVYRMKAPALARLHFDATNLPSHPTGIFRPTFSGFSVPAPVAGPFVTVVFTR